MDPEKLARLPKWAQDQIERDQQTIASLKAHIAELNQAHPDSNVQLGNYIHGDYGLPPNSDVSFYLGDPPYRKYRNVIDVQVLRTKDRKVLRVAGHDGRLLVMPSHSNVIELAIAER